MKASLRGLLDDRQLSLAKDRRSHGQMIAHRSTGFTLESHRFLCVCSTIRAKWRGHYRDRCAHKTRLRGLGLSRGRVWRRFYWSANDAVDDEDGPRWGGHEKLGVLTA